MYNCCRFAKYGSYCGIIFMDKRIPRNLRNLYTSKISMHTVVYLFRFIH